ncbi:UDP-N-acetylglucosamine 2-epimerase [Evansella caseinilytica]|uniref:UDP-N-acetylglucosamine 2-epimerase n=1 Tax=Evansella caseinilytica TaxID=1503961 RepID=A0A1H3HQ02_9BACI|nr:UDP-N-acetylglucosamine 2-epimerase [Evansella caseinilytica]SDY17512.1 UDP-N-acetylglucosamine 2-epimerase [Evansella caseinilytica]
MQSIYLKHYWNVYAEFVEAFQSLKVSGIPLALTINFHQYLDSSMKEKLAEPEFAAEIAGKIQEEETIQPYFDRFLTEIASGKKQNHPAGIALFLWDELRFPKEALTKLAANPVVLSKRKRRIAGFQGTLHTFQPYTLHDYPETARLVNVATAVFNRNRNHPLLGNSFFQDAFLRQIPEVKQMIHALEHILDVHPVSYVVIGTMEDTLCRIAALVAAKKGIDSICLQHGLIMGEEAFLPVFTTKAGVYGDIDKAWYCRKGVREEQVVITGHPRFDQLFSWKEKGTTKLAPQAKIHPDGTKHHVLIATQPSRPAAAKLWEDIVTQLAKDSSIKILIKPHPWEVANKRLGLYESLANHFSSVTLLRTLKGFSLHELLANVDAVIVRTSTVGLEAMLMGKMVFSIRTTTTDRDYYKYYSHLGPLLQSSPEKLARKVVHALTNGDGRKEAEAYRSRFLEMVYPQEQALDKLAQVISGKNIGGTPHQGDKRG